MWNSTFPVDYSIQILAELCPFENFCLANCYSLCLIKLNFVLLLDHDEEQHILFRGYSPQTRSYTRVSACATAYYLPHAYDALLAQQRFFEKLAEVQIYFFYLGHVVTRKILLKLLQFYRLNT